MEDYVTMNSGDGPKSYTMNSKIQKEGSDQARWLLSTSIQENLELQNTSRVFSIADLGWHKEEQSWKYPNSMSFSMTMSPTISTRCLRPFHQGKNYMAAGVPGSFHSRLFPKASMNVMHSSFAIQWFSKVPGEVTREDSPAWNKGRVTYALSSCQVVKAFANQLFKDMEAFFRARSVELATGGLTVVLMPCRPEGTHPSESGIHFLECLGNALMDMAKEGLVDEALVDSFNLPVFLPTPSEVKEVVSRNEHLDIVTLDEMHQPPPQLSTPEGVRLWTIHIRAGLEGFLSKHFGSSVIDELFERYCQKLEEFSKTPHFTRVFEFKNLLLLAKRNGVC
ncbi:S-adenosyl-L-methionine-dependent methyltransferases superfamily protein [Actinidia rufa]|uniref:S-adenosyl-L-methionine-dependent methyltransferases superfamily protein n=1 Tax=Actinidia rufa TaxID=165716 RepID=A0A7J0GYX0_9ERIC|nr:S-adenosyl-L-methionine-dependent methyltransferases superfamily protein [Actinidia rufa]